MFVIVELEKVSILKFPRTIVSVFLRILNNATKDQMVLEIPLVWSPVVDILCKWFSKFYGY